MKKLPVDTSSFSSLRTMNYVYVDKTEHMYNLITGGRRYFLSRPRRFGKSLLISALKQILIGNKALFNDLWIASSDYQWHEHGVIQFDFSKLETGSVAALEEGIRSALAKIARFYEIDITQSSKQIGLLLEDVVEGLSTRFGHVAILVDEYDSPIIKALHDENLARAIRNTIQQFFTVIKSLDEQVQFVFITGVSSFAKAGLFSGINNLQIITLRDKYATICGYTDQEVDHYFSDHIIAWAEQDDVSYDEQRRQIKAWYNGYSFGDSVPAVYNPFSLMNALEIKRCKNFWIESGMPTFLVEVLKKEYMNFDLGDLETSEEILGIFDVGRVPLVTLMFQAGYLTIVGYDPGLRIYKLDYPNLEVKTSFQKYLLEIFTRVDSVEAQKLLLQLFSAFNNEQIEKAVSCIKKLFAHVPYQLHSKEEKFYHGLLVMACLGAGIKAQAEFSTDHGRIDLVMELPKILYVVEVKFNKSAQEALSQIEERRYYERFIVQNKRIVLLGLSFKRDPHSFDVAYAQKYL